MAGVHVQLFGTFQVLRNREPVVFQQDAAPALLQQMIALRPNPLPAEWADSGALAEIRQLIPVHTDDQGALHLQTDRCTIDVDGFLARYRAGKRCALRGDMVPAVLAMQEAESLHQGPFLPGVDAPWPANLRAELEQIYADVLDRLADGYAVLNRYTQALAYCRKALALNPVNESAYQRLIVYSYYQGGQTEAALAYEACRLAVRIGKETEELWQRISQSEAAAAAE